MPRIEFKTENKRATTNFDYPKLKLKMGESARILLLEAPVAEYVHTLRAPKIVNGQPVIIKVDRRGTQVDDFDKDFLSRPLCLGDLSILDDQGSDVKNCPMCALAKQSPDMVQAPQRRFAMHVIRYKTKSGGTQLINPYSVEVVVWAFTDTIFNKIADFTDEWGDLRKHDLILGPCTNEMFQKADLSVAAKAAWLESTERQKLTLETFKENQIPDLAIACGTKKERRWIDEDIAVIKERWQQATGAEAIDSRLGEGSLDEGLSNLLDTLGLDDAPTEAAAGPDAEEEVDLDALMNAEVPAEPEPKKAKAEPKKAEPKKAEAAADADDFDSLLADID